MDKPYGTKKPNGEGSHPHRTEEETLYGVFHRMVSAIFFPDDQRERAPLLHRIRASVADNAPFLREASGNTGRNVLLWTRRGSPLRALLVMSDVLLCGVYARREAVYGNIDHARRVFDMALALIEGLPVVGAITLLALTGLLVFMLFFLAATVNAIVISLLVSRGFLAFFFTCVTFIYIGALSVAVFVISGATISAIIVALIVTGWIGFFWTLWLATKKSVNLAKHSLTMTGSTLSAYSSARHANWSQEPHKISD